MKILQRYVLRQLILPFILSFLTLSFIFMAGYLVRAANFIIGRGVPIVDSLYVLLLALPGIVSYTVPTSILMAVLIVFGTLTQNSEIRAIGAAGVHLIHIMTPAFLMGIILSILMFIFNDQLLTKTGFELRRTTKRMLIENPKAIIETGRFVKLTDHIVFRAKEVRGEEMIDFVAHEVEHDDKPVRTIIAERGEILSDPKSGGIQIRLYDGSVSDAADSSVQTIHFKTYEFPTLGDMDFSKMKRKKKDYTLAELLIALKEPNVNSQDETRMWSAFHQRIAFAFGSFIFVFLGIPTAILVHRGEIVMSFAMSMAGACLYYILFVGAKTIALEGVLPASLAYWIPNILLMGSGVFLIRKSFAA